MRKRLAVVILDDVSADRLTWTLINSANDGRQFAGYFYAQALASLVLDYPQSAIPNIGSFELENIGWPLPGQQCEIHRINHSEMGLSFHQVELSIRDVPRAPGFLEALNALARVLQGRTTPLPGFVEDMREKGLLAVRSDLDGLLRGPPPVRPAAAYPPQSRVTSRPGSGPDSILCGGGCSRSGCRRSR